MKELFPLFNYIPATPHILNILQSFSIHFVICFLQVNKDHVYSIFLCLLFQLSQSKYPSHVTFLTMGPTTFIIHIHYCSVFGYTVQYSMFFQSVSVVQFAHLTWNTNASIIYICRIQPLLLYNDIVIVLSALIPEPLVFNLTPVGGWGFCFLCYRSPCPL